MRSQEPFSSTGTIRDSFGLEGTAAAGDEDLVAAPGAYARM